MSLISTKGAYGILAIYEIAKGTSTEPVSINAISSATGVSKSYLEQILNALKNSRILGSIKGKNGGYFLAKSLSEITFYEVFGTLESDFKTSSHEFKAPFDELFKGFDDDIKALFSKPLSSFSIANANKYLNYAI